MINELLNHPSIRWKTILLKRSDYLLQEGDKANRIYLIKKGALRVFKYIAEEEYTIRFGHEGSIIAALPDYFKNQASSINIQALRSSEILVCPKSDFETFLNDSETHRQTYQKILEDLVCATLEREIDLMHASAADRLKRVLNRSPQLFQEIPHKYIADYLNMSAETLSRLLKS